MLNIPFKLYFCLLDASKEDSVLYQIIFLRILSVLNLFFTYSYYYS